MLLERFTYQLNSMNEEIRKLEERVSRLERMIASVTHQNIVNVPPEKPNVEVQKDNWFSQALLWLREDWLMKLGALLLILALGWFVRYAFLQNWIGPIGRISLGMAAGAGILLAGHFVIPKRNIPGQVLSALGATMILLTIFAARTVYGFFTPSTALGIMALTISLTTVSAIVRHTQALAIAALVGGAFAPILAHAPVPNYVGLFSYIFLLDLGVLFVAAFRGWRALLVLALLVTSFYGFELGSMSDVHTWIFMGMFFGLFFVASLWTILKSRSLQKADLLVAGSNTILGLWWVNEFVPDNWQSITLSLAAILSAVSAFILLRAKNLVAPVYLYSASALVLIGAATAFELEGAALIIAFSIESLGAVAVAHYGLKSPKAALSASTLYAIPILLALFDNHYANYAWTHVPFFNEHFFVALVITASLGTTAFILQSLWHTVPAILSGLALIWLMAHNLFSADIAREVSLVIFALIGVVFFFFGTKHHVKFLHVSGGVLLAGVVVRLLAVEVWAMPLSGRVITFVLIGALLIVTAFFRKRLH